MMNPRQGHRGFTLVELIVVLLITGVIISLVIPAIHVPGDDRSIEHIARQLNDKLIALQQSSLYEGKAYLLTASKGQLNLYERHDDEWLPQTTHLKSIARDIKRHTVTIKAQSPLLQNRIRDNAILLLPDQHTSRFSIRINEKFGNNAITISSHSHAQFIQAKPTSI